MDSWQGNNACLTRFNGTTRAQTGRIMKMGLPGDCMRLLVEKKLVRVEVVRNQANRNFITDDGARMVAQMVGKEVANAEVRHGAKDADLD